MDHGAAAAELAELSLADYRREVLENYRAVRAESDPERAHAGWRERRDQLFREHPQSPLGVSDPLRETGLPYWPYDPALRFEVTLTETTDPVTRTFSTAPGETTRMRRLGSVTLPAPVEGRLAVWWLEQYSGGIFLPFRDATAGDSSYGAGRYLLDTTKGADLGGGAGRLVLDFNFAYHPSCRYDDAWQCPLAPPENVLAAEIRAGERL